MAQGIRAVDYSGLTNAEARALLDEHRADVETLVGKVRTFTPGYGEEDLRSVAEVAVLEAHRTYRPACGMSPRSWAYRVVQWRLEELRSEVIDLPTDYGALAPAPGPHPEERVARIELQDWLERALASLPLQEGLILTRKLHGESSLAIGETIGLTPGRVSQLYRAGLERLRRDAARAQVVELAWAVLGIVD